MAVVRGGWRDGSYDCDFRHPEGLAFVLSIVEPCAERRVSESGRHMRHHFVQACASNQNAERVCESIRVWCRRIGVALDAFGLALAFCVDRDQPASGFGAAIAFTALHGAALSVHTLGDVVEHGVALQHNAHAFVVSRVARAALPLVVVAVFASLPWRTADDSTDARSQSLLLLLLGVRLPVLAHARHCAADVVQQQATTGSQTLSHAQRHFKVTRRLPHSVGVEQLAKQLHRLSWAPIGIGVLTAGSLALLSYSFFKRSRI